MIGMKRIILSFAFGLFVLSSSAQIDLLTKLQINYYMFNYLDVSLTGGSDGLGLDLATNIGDYMQFRAGFALMPRFEKTVSYSIGVGDDGMVSQERYDQLSGVFQQVTGCPLADRVDMVARPTFSNYKLLVDVFPFRKKRFYLSAGLYIGNSTIAKISSTAESVPTMMALNIFNRMIDCAIGEDGEGGGTFVEYGDFSLALDPSIEDKLYNLAIERTKGYVKDFDDLSFEEQTALLHRYGKYSVHIGNYVSDGSAYLLSPDEHGMIKMEVETKRLKPYLGLGYGGALSKKNDMYRISFDCGTMFWGDSPKIIMHDGTDIIHDLTDVTGKVGEYCDIVRQLKVYPVLTLRLTRRF